VLGGTQSLHTNSFDEAIALPTAKAARLALRTQQVLAHETDITRTVDPFAGSYVVESLTDDLEEASQDLIRAVDERGGAVHAIEEGFQKSEIEQSAYQTALQIDAGERVVVGQNRYAVAEEERYEPLRVDPAIEAQQVQRLDRLRAERDGALVTRLLEQLQECAQGSDNLLPPMREALRARATGGEVADALRAVWGRYVPRESF
jgi:methylmalonyl-CoA mutase, N-terminal domain